MLFLTSSFEIIRSKYSINPNLAKTVKQVLLIELEHTANLNPSLCKFLKVSTNSLLDSRLVNLIRVSCCFFSQIWLCISAGSPFSLVNRSNF